jgi:hypothetical protein
MTRARDSLALWMPLAFHVRQQTALGDRHVHAVPSRFITPAMWPLFERVAVGAPPAVEPQADAPPVHTAVQAAQARPQIEGRADAAGGTGPAPDLWAALRAPWAGPAT